MVKYEFMCIIKTNKKNGKMLSPKKVKSNIAYVVYSLLNNMYDSVQVSTSHNLGHYTKVHFRIYSDYKPLIDRTFQLLEEYYQKNYISDYITEPMEII